MALHKFEKQIQQKLNNYEIKPSANSWDRLDAMLSMEEKPKKKGFFWINIAASFVVLASIGYNFYYQNKTELPIRGKQIIVEENSELRIQNTDTNESKIIKTEIIEEVLVENNIKIKENKNWTSNDQKLVAISKTNNQKEVSIINNSTKENIVSFEKENYQKESNIQYVASEKQLNELDNKSEKTIYQESKKLKKGIYINPTTLLSKAEAELNQTYRETALEKLNKNFNNIKTVLVNRNYQE